MLFRYDPMEVDTEESPVSSDCSDMEIVYEPPKTTEESCFSVANSFLQHPYNKSGELCNKVSNLLESISLQDAQPKVVQEKESSPLLSPKSPPGQQSLSIIKKDFNTSSLCSSFTAEPVEFPATPVSLPSSPSPSPSPASAQSSAPVQAPAPATVGLGTYSQQYPSHTFVYHAPQHVDPMSQSHGTVHWMYALFKITCIAIIFSGCIYIATHLVMNVHHDMNTKIASYESDLLNDQMYCQQQYDINRCTPHVRLPAVQDLCRDWEQCMMRPMHVSRSKVLAEIMGETVNGFSNTLTLKTMTYTLCIGAGILWSLTTAFTFKPKKAIQ